MEIMRVRRHQVHGLVLAAGLGVALLAASRGGDRAAPATSTTPLAVAPEGRRLAGTLGRLVGAPLRVEAAEAAEAATPARPLVGDAALSGTLDLAAAEQVGDRYEVPLPDGRRAILTLEPRLQRAAERILARARAPRGAVVITAPDGRILALAGRRTEDPAGGKEGLADPALAVTAWAPAASIAKIATAAALVEAGVDPAAEVCYHGGLRSVTEDNLADHRRDNRCGDLAYGLAHSQNALIAKLVHRHLEPAAWRATAGALGFAGDLPPWAPGGQRGALDVPADKGVELARTAAGFRGAELSPVAGALLAATIANGGLEVTPTIVAAVVDGSGRAEVTVPPPRRVVAEAVARAVGRMMVRTCDSGSAARAFRGKDGLPRSIAVAGKTGTLSRKPAPDWPHPLEFSWFVGYAPADRPEVAIAVVLGNTDLWWLKSHTAARMLLAEALTAR
jgi:penicillin-binding protein A